VRRLVDHFGLRNCDFVVGDATSYRHPRPLDLLIVEAMQAALSKEPQVAIVRNLAPQLASGSERRSTRRTTRSSSHACP
jgi:predicted RNA methylase